MKKLCLLLACAVCGFFSVKAQRLIPKQQGIELIASVPLIKGETVFSKEQWGLGVSLTKYFKRAGRFAGTRYTLRYFQSEGKGMLRLDKGTALKPNDRYPLVREEFRLYYTSQSADRQTIDVYIEDNFGKVRQLTFSFNHKKAEEDKKKDG